MGVRRIKGGDPVGFIEVSGGNSLPIDQLLFILTTDGRSADRIRMAYREDNRVLDLTKGKKMRSQLIMKNGLMVLTPIKPDTIISRITYWLIERGKAQA